MRGRGFTYICFSVCNFLIDNMFMVKRMLPVSTGGRDLLSFLWYCLVFLLKTLFN